MPSRFGQAADYSQTFAYLAQQNYSTLKASAEALDRKREEDLAAKDEEIFTKYQEGKVSGASILRYIRMRIAQTGYDKAQQRKWQATLVQYQNAVTDERAAAAYAQNGNIGAYLAHWQKRLRGTKTGTPEYTQIQEQIKALREEQFAKSLRSRATQILNKISAGQMSTKDLLDFYRGELKNVPAGSDLKLQIREQIASLEKQWREEKFTMSMTQVQSDMAAGAITPQQAAERMRNVASTMNIDDSNPVLYQATLEQARVLDATPDPAYVAKLTFQLQTGQIDSDKYLDEMYNLADQIAPYDQAAAWELRSAAHADIKQYAPTPLPNPIGGGGGTLGAAVGMVVNAVNRVIHHVYQMDGSRFSSQNCTFAATAMLAYSMGKGGLTGSELRYLSRDREGGGTLLQAQYALERAGVSGTRAKYNDRIEFDAFIRNLKMGSTAVLSGFNGSIPARFNASGIRAGHAIFVAKFDPKKGFLVLDPAKKGDTGTWWPEEVLKAFGWGGVPGEFYRYGQALLSPRGTLDTRWNDGGTKGGRGNYRGGTGRGSGEGDTAGGRIKHVWVNDRPSPQRGVPESFVGQFAMGPADAGVVAAAFTRADKEAAKPISARPTRLEEAGIGSDIDTVEEAKEEVENRLNGYQASFNWLEKAAQAVAQDPTAESWSVTVGNDTQILTKDDVNGLEREMLLRLDGVEILGEALAAPDVVRQARSLKNEVVVVGSNITDMAFATRLAVVQQGIANTLKNSLDVDPAAALDDVGAAAQAITSLLEANGHERVEGPPAPDGTPAGQNVPAAEGESEVQQQIEGLTEVGLTEEGGEALQQAIGLQALYDIALDPSLPWEQRVDAIEQTASAYGIELPYDGKDLDWRLGKIDPKATDIGSLFAAQAYAVGQVFQVQNGEAEWMLVPQGEGSTVIAVPLRYSAGYDPTGQRATQQIGVTPETAAGEPAIDPNTGQPLEVPMVVGAQVELDMKWLRDNYGIEMTSGQMSSSNNLPVHVMIVDGEEVVMRALPRRIDYPGNNMLLVKDAGKYKALTGIKPPDEKQSGLLTQSDLDALVGSEKVGAAGISRLIDDGILEEVPYQVDVVVAPPYVDSKGTLLPGKTFVVDPLTNALHSDGLPMLGTVNAERNAAQQGLASVYGLGWVGARINEQGHAEPDVTYLVPTDLPEGKGIQASFSPGVSMDFMQTALENGELGDPILLERGPDGKPRQYDMASTMFTNMYTSPTMTWAEAMKPFQFTPMPEDAAEGAAAMADATPGPDEVGYQMAMRDAGFDPNGQPISTGFTPAGLPSADPSWMADMRKQFGLVSLEDSRRAAAFSPPPPRTGLPAPAPNTGSALPDLPKIGIPLETGADMWKSIGGQDTGYKPPAPTSTLDQERTYRLGGR